MTSKRVISLLLALTIALFASSALAADGFTDVADDAYYADAVAWAMDNDVAEGRGDGIFDPDATVTRAEAATFLWRMAGRPEPTAAETFADVEADEGNAWYKTAVLWAAENGISIGTGGGNFSPTVTCTRGMILTMIYRMEGCPFDAPMSAAVPENSEDWTLDDLGNALIQSFVEGFRGENGFTDVPEGAYYELPIVWAALYGLLGEEQVDIERMAVQPSAPCPRGEMVYFLCRAAEYEAAAASAGEAYSPVEPPEVGTIPETVVLDKDGVKITVTGIETDDYGDAVLDLTMENGSSEQLAPEVYELFVNTYSVSPSVYIAVKDEYGTSYSSPVAAAGETVSFNVSLNSLRDKGISSVYELELTMSVFTSEETEDGWEYEEYARGDAAEIKTDLYSEDVSYEPEGTVIYDKDGLKLLVFKAENNEYMGPQIGIYAYNASDEDVSAELSELKLDGETYDAFFSLYISPGKRSADTVWIDLDYENIPAVKEAELTFRTLDPETWEPELTFDPVTVTFED
ncbi:MAG: S-layer homology domain-containing protein [Oscillospiraceae bacterium]|nr:S-layer homology domain-containing protein [Oscillospiraceae bacterium]